MFWEIKIIEQHFEEFLFQEKELNSTHHSGDWGVLKFPYLQSTLLDDVYNNK